MRVVRQLFTRALARSKDVPSARTGLGEGDRGTVLVEYTAVFAFVSIGLAIAIVALGPVLLKAWGVTQGVLLAARP